MRSTDVQICPALANAPVAACRAAQRGSTPASTISGSLPPSSSSTFLSWPAQVSAMRRPVPTEPTWATRSTPACLTRAAPELASPSSRFTTPGGSPASSASSPSRATAAVARLVGLADEAGLPPGVVNLLLGDASSGAALVRHAGVDLVAHVGSVGTGRRIAETCAGQLKKVLLELGGKDPLIVDAGVDPRWAARQAATGAFANAGQICTSVERSYVHADIAAQFVEALVDEAESQVLGDPADPATTMGPLVDSDHRDAVHAHVTAALQAGAVLRAGGVVPKGPGAVSYPATVLTEVTEDMAVLRDETFGPVAPVRVVSSFDEALQ